MCGFDDVLQYFNLLKTIFEVFCCGPVEDYIGEGFEHVNGSLQPVFKLLLSRGGSHLAIFQYEGTPGLLYVRVVKDQVTILDEKHHDFGGVMNAINNLKV